MHGTYWEQTGYSTIRLQKEQHDAQSSCLIIDYPFDMPILHKVLCDAATCHRTDTLIVRSSSLERITDTALSDFTGLKKVIFNKDFLMVDADCFKELRLLEEVCIGNVGIKDWVDGTHRGLFEGLPELRQICYTGVQGLTLRHRMFKDCPQLDIDSLLKNRIDMIQSRVFENHPVKAVHLPASLHTLYADAFLLCPQLEEVHIHGPSLAVVAGRTRYRLFDGCPVVKLYKNENTVIFGESLLGDHVQVINRN